MTAVICWSMNIKIVPSKAGIIAARHIHHGFWSTKGEISHPLLSLFVGSNFSGTSNFGVFNPIKTSVTTMQIIAIMTAKSLIILRTYKRNMTAKSLFLFQTYKINRVSEVYKHMYIFRESNSAIFILFLKIRNGAPDKGKRDNLVIINHNTPLKRML